MAQGVRVNLFDLAAGLSNIVDLVNPLWVNHHVQVAYIAFSIGDELGLSMEEKNDLVLAGALHDIGMLVVPIEILEKEEPLTEEEFSIIRKYPFYTNSILKRIAAFKDNISWASHHHETLSRAGYPFHVTDDLLPLEARILAVADVFTSLTETRPYRKKFSGEAIQEELKKMGEGLKLDSNIVSLLLLHFNEVNSVRIAAQGEAKEEYLNLSPTADSWRVQACNLNPQ